VLGIDVLRRNWCSFAVWGLADTDLMVHIVASRFCSFHRDLGDNANTLIPVGLFTNNPALKELCVSLNRKSSKTGWIPVSYFRQSKTANHIIPLQPCIN
jgi:hypothetical protein